MNASIYRFLSFNSIEHGLALMGIWFHLWKHHSANSENCLKYSVLFTLMRSFIATYLCVCRQWKKKLWRNFECKIITISQNNGASRRIMWHATCVAHHAQLTLKMHCLWLLNRFRFSVSFVEARAINIINFSLLARFYFHPTHVITFFVWMYGTAMSSLWLWIWILYKIFHLFWWWNFFRLFKIKQHQSKSEIHGHNFHMVKLSEDERIGVARKWYDTI